MILRDIFKLPSGFAVVEVKVRGTPGSGAPVGSVQKQRLSHQEANRPPALGNGKQSSC